MGSSVMMISPKDAIFPISTITNEITAIIIAISDHISALLSLPLSE